MANCWNSCSIMTGLFSLFIIILGTIICIVSEKVGDGVISFGVFLGLVSICVGDSWGEKGTEEPIFSHIE